MRFHTGWIACLVTLAGTVSPAQARLAVGYADTACAHWNDIRSSSAVVDVVREDGMVQWVSGYLTAVNAMRVSARQRPYALPSYSALKALIHTRCTTMPARTFQQVADGLHLELREAEPPTVNGD
ncbi:hypothetical protein ACFX58_11380 [Sphingomonas sp. NCPPB 2930]